MKNLIKQLTVIILAVFIFTSCKKQEYNLDRLLDRSELKFDVIQDLTLDAGGNTVILVNNTPDAIGLWNYGTGISTKSRDTVRFAFEGEYEIKFLVSNGGGITEAEPIKIKVTQDNLNYVSDPLWINLSGGPGNEKTWVLDYGNHGIFDGPVYYYEPATTWTEFQNGTAKLGWAPAWKDNTWLISANDTASTMTFSLKGGPYFKTHKVTEGVDESGTYYLDAANKTLTTTGGTILRSQSFIANATNWNNKLVVLSLTENQLQIGVRRTNSEGDYLYVWNYVSKEYADSHH